MLSQNPIIQAISGSNSQQANNSGLANFISMIKGNPNAMFDQLMRTNPQFVQFVNANKGKSAEQIAFEHGIDMNSVRQFMK